MPARHALIMTLMLRACNTSSAILVYQIATYIQCSFQKRLDRLSHMMCQRIQKRQMQQDKIILGVARFEADVRGQQLEPTSSQVFCRGHNEGFNTYEKQHAAEAWHSREVNTASQSNYSSKSALVSCKEIMSTKSYRGEERHEEGQANQQQPEESSSKIRPETWQLAIDDRQELVSCCLGKDANSLLGPPVHAEARAAKSWCMQACSSNLQQAQASPDKINCYVKEGVVDGSPARSRKDGGVQDTATEAGSCQLQMTHDFKLEGMQIMHSRSNKAPTSPGLTMRPIKTIMQVSNSCQKSTMHQLLLMLVWQSCLKVLFEIYHR